MRLPPFLRSDARPVSVVFFGNGAFIAAWAPHVPYVRDHVGLTDGVLGLVLLVMALGAVAAMVSAAPVSARVGAQRVTLWAAVALAIALPLPMLAPSLWTLLPAAAFFGGSIGTMDVAMNAVAADVEKAARRPLMSGFHGMFSLGALVGSGASALAIRAGLTPTQHTVATSVVVLAALYPFLRRLPASAPPSADAGSGRVRLPSGALLVIGIIALVVLAAEGAVTDWSALLLRDYLGASGAVAALGFGSLALTMALFRFFGDGINVRVGPVALVLWGAALAAVGLLVAVTAPNAALGIAGFAIVGIGLSNTVPVVFSAAAARGRTSAEGLSSVAAFGYLGFLAAPPAIGWISDASSLRWSLAGMALLCLVAAGLARVVAPERAATVPTSASKVPRRG